jgi:hypothetical protein
MANNQTGMFGAHPDARHSRIAIGVGEINIPRDKDVRIIRASRPDDKHAQNQNLDRDTDSTGHAPIPNPQAEIEDPFVQSRFF